MDSVTMTNKLKPANLKIFAVQFICILIFLGVDQISKYLIERYLRPVGTFPLIKGVLNLHYLQNTGAAFGSLSEHTALLSLVTSVVLFGILAFIFVDKSGNIFYRIFLPFIVCGGLGNLVDRVSKGYVVDFIELPFLNFAVFNFADMLVTSGAFCLCVYLVWSLFKERKESADNASSEIQEADKNDEKA